MADVPEFEGHFSEFRQLWVNDRKRCGPGSPMVRPWLALPSGAETTPRGWIPKALAGPYRDRSDLEMTVLQQWEVANLRVKSLKTEGDRTLRDVSRSREPAGVRASLAQPIMEPEGAPSFLGVIELL